MIVLDTEIHWSDYRPLNITKSEMREKLEYLIHQLSQEELEHKYYQFVSKFCKRECDAIHIGYIGGHKGIFLIVPIPLGEEGKVKFACKLSNAPCHYKTETDIAKDFVEFAYLENLLVETINESTNKEGTEHLINFVSKKTGYSAKDAEIAVNKYIKFICDIIYPFLSGKTTTLTNLI